MKFIVVCGQTQCSLIDRYQCFEGLSCLHLQGARVRRAGNKSAEERIPLGLIWVTFRFPPPIHILGANT